MPIPFRRGLTSSVDLLVTYGAISLLHNHGTWRAVAHSYCIPTCYSRSFIWDTVWYVAESLAGQLGVFVSSQRIIYRLMDDMRVRFSFLALPGCFRVSALDCLRNNPT